MNTWCVYTLCLFIIHTPVFLNGRKRMTRYQPPLEYQPLELWPDASSDLVQRTTELHNNHDDHKKLLSLFARTNKEVKDAEAFLSVMLRMLKTLFVKKPPVDNTKPKSERNKQGIAWSYYDDAGK